MKYRTLGKTGLSVSILGFGASSLGGVFGDVTEEQCVRTVHTALDGGVNLIDTSPFYGLTRSESMLRPCLRGVPRERYLLSTKVGRYGSELADFDFSAERVTRSVDESLARIGVDHVDIVLAHDIEFGNVQQVIEETVPALRKVQAVGKARLVGVSGLPLRTLLRVAEAVPLDVVLSYCHYALNDTALVEYLPRFEALGVAVIGASPLSMGLLTHDRLPAWHPAPPALREACRQAAELCERRGTRLEKLAIQFAVANERIPTMLVGTAEPERMAENLAWIEERIDTQLLAEVQAILAPVHNMTWPSGRPENN